MEQQGAVSQPQASQASSPPLMAVALVGERGQIKNTHDLEVEGAGGGRMGMSTYRAKREEGGGIIHAGNSVPAGSRRSKEQGTLVPGRNEDLLVDRGRGKREECVGRGMRHQDRITRLSPN